MPRPGPACRPACHAAPAATIPAAAAAAQLGVQATLRSLRSLVHVCVASQWLMPAGGAFAVSTSTCFCQLPSLGRFQQICGGRLVGRQDVAAGGKPAVARHRHGGSARSMGAQKHGRPPCPSTRVCSFLIASGTPLQFHSSTKAAKPADSPTNLRNSVQEQPRSPSAGDCLRGDRARQSATGCGRSSAGRPTTRHPLLGIARRPPQQTLRQPSPSSMAPTPRSSRRGGRRCMVSRRRSFRRRPRATRFQPPALSRCLGLQPSWPLTPGIHFTTLPQPRTASGPRYPDPTAPNGGCLGSWVAATLRTSPTVAGRRCRPGQPGPAPAK